ncbi:SDR family NAD(P)-dependent oxidoreductase [Bradyrhizobium canariense]|uniref:SDR family NAD(P)-dependent oxidoreductase n=1 Tax=Bradyrhizobium canariense TaxID=255045 RepID=UPI000A18C1F4|nr:glucose 1-dehydrogenase [Bradyrhizobium canariense]OSI22325.1 short-chain dehydrogenase [Bradyrhizobium canariense]OSI26922.1 short-chain dehydrogenase [Bradyrhizobium canariense]OSI46037.1 short-chain dehydrogenase [Bradyrhizobium canariense]OSI51609.1 short-chain dehydrogenase [Bradyrhizobium canariense]
MTKRLEGKVALVTGASKGIGAEIAARLAAEGAAVAVNYSSSEQAADRVVAAIVAKGGKAVAVHGNLADAKDVKSVVADTVKALGAIDILVNNAGVYEFAPLDAITPEHFHKQFDLNVLGLLLVSGEAARHFNANGGSIINISSAASTLAPPNGAVYSATKASVDAISAVLAKELAPRKIRVNAVNPGMIVTEGVVSAGLHEGDMRKWIESTTPLGRVGKVEEIAAAVAFFASDDASYVTGETLHVAGGLR